MKSTTLLRRALPLALLLAGPAGAMPVYEAPVDQSSWQSQADGAVCHLSHSVPLFGTAVFSQDLAGRMAFSLSAIRPPEGQPVAELFVRGTEWRPTPEEALSVQAEASGTVVSFDSTVAKRLLAQLEAGQVPVVRWSAGWGGGPVEVALSPVAFREGLRAHLRCLGQLSRPGQRPSVGAATPSQAGSVIVPAMVSTPLESGEILKTANAVAAESPGLKRAAVYFATDNAGLDRESMDTLRAVADYLKAHPQWSALLSTGHADKRGTDARNRRLATQRAEAVRAYLSELGVDGKRVRIRGQGAAEAGQYGADTYGLARDRRVDVDLIL